MTKKKKKQSKKTTEKEQPKAQQSLVRSIFAKERIITENSNEARELYNQSRYGAQIEDGRLQLTLIESLYLIEKKRLVVLDGRNKPIEYEKFLKRAQRIEPNFLIRYAVFKDIRNRGYIIKTALKFGADFRVYDRGVKPGDDHAKWIVYPVHEADTMTWYEFAAKNRVAHSTKKKLLLGIVDEESDVTYYEIKWTRP